MIDAEKLRQVLNYDPNTGLFTWKYRPEMTKRRATRGQNSRVGQIAGCVASSHGYIVIGVDNRRYLAHRIAWLYMTGEWPKDQIDHINMVRTDNRFCNLRTATSAQNKLNKGMEKTNTSGFKGVRLHVGGLWQARAQRNRKQISIGYFKTIEEAAAARARWVAENDGDFARL